MRIGRLKLTGLGVVCTLAILSAQASAQDVEIEQREAEQAMQQQKQALREAERELQEAARRMAELSRAAAPEVMIRAERMASIGRGPRLGLGLSTQVIDGAPVDDGVRVQSVSPGSAADEAGVKAGDLLVAFQGEALRDKSASDAVALIGSELKDKEVGDSVELKIERDGKEADYTLTLNDQSFASPAVALAFGDDENMIVEIERLRASDKAFPFYEGRVPGAPPRPPLPPGANFLFISSDSPWANMELVELSPGLGKYFNADSGLLVVSIPEDNELGFQDGDVIRTIDGRTPEDVGHAMRILRSYQTGEEMKIEILRDRKKKRLSIKVPEKVGANREERHFEWHSAPPAIELEESVLIQ